jgi:glycosyltransferase involved in cell wall biosynthesis
MKILYVCPSAHRPSHIPYFLIKESAALLRSGEQVSILTFSGILGGREPKDIYHMTVVSAWYGSLINVVLRLLNWLNLKTLVGFVEQFTTLLSAINLRKHLGCDLLYLREGDPFIFVPFILDLFSKRKRWIISMLGLTMRISPGSAAYKFINASFWKLIYRRGLSRNRFVLLCENNYVEDYFKSKFMDGIFSTNVELVRTAVEDIVEVISKKDARYYLGIQEDKIVILHFGALHGGKDIETVIQAVKHIPDVILLQVGKVTSSINVQAMVQNLGLQDRVIIKDYYVPESEKGYYFAAADAAVLSYKKDFLQATGMLWEIARYGLPSIASNVGELGYFVKNYDLGLTFEAEDADSLKKALMKFLQYDQDKKEDLRANCYNFCREFSINRWAQRFIDISSRLYNK